MGTVAFVLGAGFAKSANLPVQAEVTQALLSSEFEGPVELAVTRALAGFLRDVFGWREGRPLPSLEDLFTCIDLAADTGHHLGVDYPRGRLRALRRLAVHRVLSILDRPAAISADIEQLLAGALHEDGTSFVVLNWDLVLEQHLRRAAPHVPLHYCCTCRDWNRPDLPAGRRGIAVCKMHGSSNWVYCDNCRTLFFDLEEKLSLRTRSSLAPGDLRRFDATLTDRALAEALAVSLGEHGCRLCGNAVSPHIATFSYRKSFRTAVFADIWAEAERVLALADRWVFIGYSLPEADYELKHLLKSAQRALSHRSGPKRIEAVVQKDPEAREKFETFFGAELAAFHEGGLADYVARARPS